MMGVVMIRVMVMMRVCDVDVNVNDVVGVIIGVAAMAGDDGCDGDDAGADAGTGTGMDMRGDVDSVAVVYTGACTASVTDVCDNMSAGIGDDADERVGVVTGAGVDDGGVADVYDSVGVGTYYDVCVGVGDYEWYDGIVVTRVGTDARVGMDAGNHNDCNAIAVGG